MGYGLIWEQDIRRWFLFVKQVALGEYKFILFTFFAGLIHLPLVVKNMGC